MRKKAAQGRKTEAGFAANKKVAKATCAEENQVPECLNGIGAGQPLLPHNRDKKTGYAAGKAH